MSLPDGAEAQVLAHVHPLRCPFTHGLVPVSRTIESRHLSPGTVLGPPSAQSPFARRRRYLRRDGVQHRLGGRYPSFFAHTGSCAEPNPSPRLQHFARTGSLCRLLPAPAGRWPFPTLSLRVLPWMLGSVPRWLVRCIGPLLPPRRRPSPRGSVGRRATTLPLQVTSCGNPFSQCVVISHVQASRFACHPCHPHRCEETPQGGRGVYVRAELRSLPP